MKGIIVLDGPDACGKTTLAKDIEERCRMLGIPYQYQHAEYRFKDRMFQYHEAIVRKAIRHSQSGLAVIDRLHWSEYVYGKVFRGGSRWPLQWRYFDRLLQKYCAMQVICCGQSTEEVVKWHEEAKGERSEMYEKGLDAVAAEFINIYNNHYKRQDYYFYYRAWHPSYFERYQLIDFFLETIMDMREKQLPYALEENSYNLLGYVPQAKFVFLGERLNNKGRHKIWPFWEYAHSSLYLTKALDEINFNERDAVWTNYFVDDENEFYLHDILEYNSSLKIVSFGQEQMNGLRKKGFNLINIYHPSYAKRFAIKDYGNILKEKLGYA